MTIDDLVSIVTDQLDPGKKAQYTELVKKIAASGAKSISSKAFWPFRKSSQTITTAVGDWKYTMSKDCGVIGGGYGVILDSSSNPTKNRLRILSDEDVFNQIYLDVQGTTTTDTTGVPSFVVPLVERADKGLLQVRLYQTPDAVYSVRVPYYTLPSANDLPYIEDDLLLSYVYMHLGSLLTNENAIAMGQTHRELLKDALLRASKTVELPPVFRPNPRVSAFNLEMRSRQVRR